MNPLVSVITPAYNAEKTLYDSCKSVLNQDYQEIELLIIVNGCTDNTQKEAFKLMTEDARVKVINSAKGKVPARNKGIFESQGELIALNDADDIWLPKKLEKQLEEIAKGADIVGGRIECIDSTGVITKDPLNRPTENEDIVRYLLNRVNPIANSSAIFKKSLIENIGIYDDCFPFCEDYHFWLKAIKFAKFKNVDDIVMRYFIHQSAEYDHNIPVNLSAFYNFIYNYTGVFKS